MIDRQRLEGSALFSSEWYRRARPDADGDPIQHYIEHGGRTGADPHPIFSTEWYLQRYPEAVAWPTPLHHFLDVGRNGALDPHPLFSSQCYARQRPGIPDGMTPAEHYLEDAGRGDPHPLFSNEHYREQAPGSIASAEPPLTNYLTWGAERGISPSPMVDLADLRRRLPHTRGFDPLSYLLAKLSLGEASDLPPSLPTSPYEADSDDRSDADWRWEYLVEQQWLWPQTFVLTRIIGNDLPPRHTHGQTLENVRFILENEPLLQGCEKRWVVNRIVDQAYEHKLLDLLDEFEQDYLVIPFEPEAYRHIGWRFDDFAAPGVAMGRFPPGVSRRTLHVALDHLYHDKNLYVMNNNGARNFALADGCDRATWVLPFDGNCYFTHSAWAEVREAVRARPHLRYFTVPMARVINNDELLQPGFSPSASEEPQLIFRCDAIERFNENARYGRRPKVELFYRLGIPGPWDRWRFLPWEETRPGPGPDAGRWGTAGWVARLFSGRAELEADIKARGLQRIEAIRRSLDELDETLARQRFSSDRLFVLSDDALTCQTDKSARAIPAWKHLHATLLRNADEVLTRPIRTVLDKTSIAPSGDPHDYWHPAPHWSPDRNRDAPGRHGERVTETQLGGRRSRRFDRAALQELFDGVFVLSLAGQASGSPHYHVHASRLIEAWFVDPATRMNPHLRYADAGQVRADGEGQPQGISDFRDIHFLLEGVRLLERSGSFAHSPQLKSWLGEYRAWMRESPQGHESRTAPSPHATWFDVQEAAISAYLDDVRGVLAVLRRSEERLREHFGPEGCQPVAAQSSASLHLHTDNLQGFVVLCHMADRVGIDLWRAEAQGRRPLRIGLEWLLAHTTRPWPLPQSKPFDHDRLLALALNAQSGYPEVASGLTWREGVALRPVLSPRFGLRPFWQFGLERLSPAAVPTREGQATR